MYFGRPDPVKSRFHPPTRPGYTVRVSLSLSLFYVPVNIELNVHCDATGGLDRVRVAANERSASSHRLPPGTRDTRCCSQTTRSDPPRPVRRGAVRLDVLAVGVPEYGTEARQREGETARHQVVVMLD